MDYKEKYELGSIVTAKRTYNGEIITGEFAGFHLLDKSNPKSIVGVVHTPNGSYDVEPNSIESVISEDGRIRRKLIEALKECGFTHFNDDFTVQEALAWLEKQDPKNHEEELERAYKCADEVQYRKGFEDGVAYVEKQGEQKPAMEGTFVNVDEIREDFVSEIYRVLDTDLTNERANQIIEAFDRFPTVTIQKPTWNEEDKQMINDSIKYLELFDAQGIHEDRAVPCLNWLKSLKERMQSQSN